MPPRWTVLISFPVPQAVSCGVRLFFPVSPVSLSASCSAARPAVQGSPLFYPVPLPSGQVVFPASDFVSPILDLLSSSILLLWILLGFEQCLPFALAVFKASMIRRILFSASDLCLSIDSALYPIRNDIKEAITAPIARPIKIPMTKSKIAHTSSVFSFQWSVAGLKPAVHNAQTVCTVCFLSKHSLIVNFFNFYVKKNKTSGRMHKCLSGTSVFIRTEEKQHTGCLS